MGAEGVRRGRGWKSVLAATAAAAVLGSAVFGTAAAAQEVRLEIAAQPLESALEVLATQADVQVMTESADVAGIAAPALSGTYTVDEAVALLLTGTGLEARRIGDDAIVVRRPAGDADVRTTESNRPGLEDLNAAPRDTIIVTGTQIRGLPQEYVASPVFTYTAEDIAQSGFSTLAGYIQSVPQNFRGEFGEVYPGGLTGTDNGLNQEFGFASPSLRGLGADATLTLLNGRRLPNVGLNEAPTVSLLPAALIERVDVIADGASATYGADAVGGVINFVTRHDYQGLQLSARASTATELDHSDYQLSGVGGRSWSGGNAFGAISWQDRELLLGDIVSGAIGGRSDVQSTIFPEEQLLNIFAGISQQAGDVTFSLEGAYFERDSKTQYTRFLLSPLPSIAKTHTNGYALYSSLNWQVSDRTSVEVLLDYHENDVDRERSLDQAILLSDGNSNSLLLSEVRLQSEFFDLPAGAVRFALGAQYRREELTTNTPGNFAVAGGAKEEVTSVYGEAFVPVVSEEQSVPFVKSLTASLAGRYEDFEGSVGTAFAPKVGARWEVNDVLSLHATYSESFLSPKLRDLAALGGAGFSFRATTDLFQEEQDPRVGDGQSIVLTVSGDNPDLVPQDAQTYTIGFDVEASGVNKVNLGAGFYQVEFSNRIGRVSQSEAFQVPGYQFVLTRDLQPGDVSAFLAGYPLPPYAIQAIGLPGFTGGNVVSYPSLADVPADLIDAVQVIYNAYPLNFTSESTQGIDFHLNLSRPLGGGDISLGVTGQYILELERQASAAAAPLSRVDTIYNPVDLTMTGNIGWRRGPFAMGSQISYTDDYEDNRVGQDGVTVDSYTTASLYLTWNNEPGTGLDWLGDSTVNLTVANVFDEQPPQIEQLGQSWVLFDPLNAATNPRRVAVTLTRRW